MMSNWKHVADRGRYTLKVKHGIAEYGRTARSYDSYAWRIEDRAGIAAEGTEPSERSAVITGHVKMGILCGLSDEELFELEKRVREETVS